MQVIMKIFQIKNLKMVKMLMEKKKGVVVEKLNFYFLFKLILYYIIFYKL